MNIEEEPRITETSRTDELIGEQISTLKERAEKNFPGARYAAFWSHEEHRIVFAPIHAIVGSKFNHALDYGSGIFEGSSAMVNERSGIPHVLLHQQRMDRMFKKSVPARDLIVPFTQEEFSQAILDIVAVNGMELFKDPKEGDKLVRAYIRPTIHPAPLGGFGVSMRNDYPVDAAVITWAWPNYLNPQVYTDGMQAAITGQQRLFPITGKHASNYGAAGMEGRLVRQLGVDELIYLAPYLIDENGSRYWADPNDEEAKLRDGVLADGPGEEIFAITADQKTLVYPPMRVNRLGGTVLEYVAAYMAKHVGLETEERDITMRDIMRGTYAGIGMMGNAVKVAPVQRIKLLQKDGSVFDWIEFSMSESLLRLMDRWDKETRGLIDPSHPSLVTSADLNRGRNIRGKLDMMFAS